MKEEFITQGGIETFPDFPVRTILPESDGENSGAGCGSGDKVAVGIAVSGEISPGFYTGADGLGGGLSSEVVPNDDMSPGDVVLSGTVPRAEYMYGCAATSVGMLLGYYDLYGYRSGEITYNMDNLIEGTISVDSRGSDGGSIYDMTDPSLLATFIASDQYVNRFYGTSSSAERPYTYVNGDPAQGLNISVWNCLADYLGTGQYWRGNGDLSTKHYTATLSWLKTTGQTYTVDAVSLPARYVDFKYGLSLYVEGRGYTLDAAKTQTLEVGGGFTFSMLKAEIDAGRPVLLSMRSADNHGHMVLAYGYNAGTQEVIFDDTYDTDCRMSWGGTYDYSSRDFHLTEATTVVFNTTGLPVSSSTEVHNAVVAGTVVIDSGKTYFDTSVISGGKLRVQTGGAASSTAIGSGGSMTVSNGAAAAGTTVAQGGWMVISNGGTATAITENGGYVYVNDGANVTFAPNTFDGLVLSGSATLHSGTTANSATMNSGHLYIFGGGTANAATVNTYGRVLISSGGRANRLTVNAYGQVSACNAATVNNVAVGAYGQLYVSSGGKVTGEMNLANGATVSAYAGSIIDFDISGRTAGSGALVSNLSRIYGMPGYTVTVSPGQTQGKYSLAAGAASFNKTVTVRLADNTELGTISAGGTLSAGGKTYSLAKESSTLTLTVYGLDVVAGGFSGGASTEVLKHNSDGSLAIFNTQTGVSTPVGNLDRAKWAIKGAGDYSHTGSTEVLMQNLQTGDVYLVANAAAGVNEAKVTQSVRLGIVSGGYELGGVGNFNGSTHPGVLLTAPEQVSPGFSKVTGLACWTLDDAFYMHPGWLGAMVTTWDGGLFKIDPADMTASDAAINAKYYSFELIGTGDFNGDGKDDVMIRNNMPKTAEGRNITGSGDVFVFLTGPDISGYQAVNVAYTGCAADPWRLAGVGDLNGDGIQDAILQNTEDGGIASWILNSEARYVSASGIGTLTAGQSFAGVGDVDGDNIDDVLFTDSDGSLKAWTVDNGAYKGLIALG